MREFITHGGERAYYLPGYGYGVERGIDRYDFIPTIGLYESSKGRSAIGVLAMRFYYLKGRDAYSSGSAASH